MDAAPLQPLRREPLDSSTFTGRVPVTGLSIFFALLALAFSAMTQPSGRVSGAPTHISFQLRISHIECGANNLLTTLGLMYQYCITGSFAGAVHGMIIERFWLDTDAYTQNEEPRYVQISRWIVFAMTSTQAIKIFLCTDLPLEKAWAACYLADWLLGEMLLELKRHYTPTEEELRAHTATLMPMRSIRCTVGCVSALGPLYFGSLALEGLVQARGLEWNCLQVVGLVVIVFGCVPFVICSIGASEENKWFREPTLTSVVVVIGLSYAMLLFIKPLTHIPQFITNISTAGMATGWAIMCVPWVYKTIKNVEGVEAYLAWWFFSVHLVSAYLFYLYGYDESTKSRPAWTEKLG